MSELVTNDWQWPRSRSRYDFSAADTETVGYRLHMTVPTHVFGVGSQGSVLGDGIAKMAAREFGRLPGAFNYLLVDAAARRLDMQGHFIDIGIDGSGTDPNEGLERFNEHYAQIRDALTQQILDLFRPDPEFPLDPTAEPALNVWIVSGSGGTSGGALHRTIDMVHDIAHEWKIAQPRVHVIMIGAEMPLRDRTRQVVKQQQQVVRDTAALNSMKIAADMASAGNSKILRPARLPFAIKSSQRVLAFLLVDQCNGCTQFSTTESLTDMLVSAVFPVIFTQAGIYVADRRKDLDQLGAMCRGQG